MGCHGVPKGGFFGKGKGVNLVTVGSWLTVEPKWGVVLSCFLGQPRKYQEAFGMRQDCACQSHTIPTMVDLNEMYSSCQMAWFVAFFEPWPFQQAPKWPHEDMSGAWKVVQLWLSIQVQLTSCFFKPPVYPFSGPNSGKRGAQCFRRFLVWTCRMWSTGLRSKVGVSQLCLKRVWTSLFLWTWKCFISWDMPLLLWHCRIQDDPIRTLFEASPVQRKLCLLAPGTICQWSSARHLLVRLLRSYGSKTCQRTNG